MHIKLLNQKQAICILSKEETEYYDLYITTQNKQEIKQDFILDIMKALNVKDCYLGLEIEVLIDGRSRVLVNLLDEKDTQKGGKYADTPLCRLDGENDYIDFEYENEDEDEFDECTMLSAPKDKKTRKEYFKTYCFDNIDILINAVQCINKWFNGDSFLYKDEFNDKYYLLLDYILSLNEVEFINNKLSDFVNVSNRQYDEMYIKEHFKCIISSDAISILSKF